MPLNTKTEKGNMLGTRIAGTCLPSTGVQSFDKPRGKLVCGGVTVRAVHMPQRAIPATRISCTTAACPQKRKTATMSHLLVETTYSVAGSHANTNLTVAGQEVREGVPAGSVGLQPLERSAHRCSHSHETQMPKIEFTRRCKLCELV